AHQTVCEFRLWPVAQHGCKASAYAPVVKLHGFIGAEALKDQFALFVLQAAEIQLVMIAQKRRPLGSGEGESGCIQCARQRFDIATGQRIKNILVHEEIKHQMNAIPLVAKVLATVFGKNICFAQQNRVSLTPLEKPSHFSEILEADFFRCRRLPGLKNKGDGVDAKPLNAQLRPETHYISDFSPDFDVVNVEIRLKFVKAVVIPGTRLTVTRPGRLLHTRKYD